MNFNKVDSNHRTTSTSSTNESLPTPQIISILDKDINEIARQILALEDVEITERQTVKVHLRLTLQDTKVENIFFIKNSKLDLLNKFSTISSILSGWKYDTRESFPSSDPKVECLILIKHENRTFSTFQYFRGPGYDECKADPDQEESSMKHVCKNLCTWRQFPTDQILDEKNEFIIDATKVYSL